MQSRNKKRKGSRISTSREGLAFKSNVSMTVQFRISYRKLNNISHSGGTAVNIVARVFGNMGRTARPGWLLSGTHRMGSMFFMESTSTQMRAMNFWREAKNGCTVNPGSIHSPEQRPPRRSMNPLQVKIAFAEGIPVMYGVVSSRTSNANRNDGENSDRILIKIHMD